MGQIDRQRHQRVRLVAGEAEHHPLVAGPAEVDAHRDVRRLRVQVAMHLAGVRREADVRVDVADLADRVADDFLHDCGRQVGLRGDLAGDDDQVSRDQRFAGDAAGRVGGQAVVEDRVGNLVGDLIRVSHRHRFAGKQVTVRSHG